MHLIGASDRTIVGSLKGVSRWSDLDLCTGMRRYIAEVEAIYDGVRSELPMREQRLVYERMARQHTRRRPAGVRVREEYFVNAEGDRLRLRIYLPPEVEERSPAIVYFHGGGFALGSLDSHDCVVAELALASSAIAISVEYRLAPEYPFPAPFEDAYSAWQHVCNRSEAWGLDPARTIIAGDSAGGGLAAAVCLKCRSERRQAPTGQLLIYPTLTARADLPSYVEQAGAPMLTAPTLAHFWKMYTEADRHAAEPFAAPLEASDFVGLPPASIATAHYDPCRDDGAVYADRLARDGVAVDYRCARTLAHGYLRARSMSPAAAREFVALSEGARALFRGAAGMPYAANAPTAA